MRNLLTIITFLFAINVNADATSDYMNSAEYFKDVACYSHYIVVELDKAIHEKPLREGYDGLLLMSKGRLAIEKQKTRRTMKYNAAQYQRKSKKKWKAKNCSSYKSIVAKGQKLEVYELYYMEFAAAFSR